MVPLPRDLPSDLKKKKEERKIKEDFYMFITFMDRISRCSQGAEGGLVL